MRYLWECEDSQEVEGGCGSPPGELLEMGSHKREIERAKSLLIKGFEWASREGKCEGLLVRGLEWPITERERGTSEKCF